MLSADDSLPCRPKRIVVAGASGSGKTTLAGRIAGLLGVPHTEIDGLFHGPGWTPRESFLADVERFTATDSWITEWQYSLVRDLLVDRADLMIWLDLPRRTVMRQVVGRTLRRRFRRQELWNGNLEPPLWTIFTDPDHIVRWSWNSYTKTRVRVAEVRPDLPVVRLAGRDEVERWMDGPLAVAARRAPG